MVKGERRMAGGKEQAWDLKSSMSRFRKEVERKDC